MQESTNKNGLKHYRQTKVNILMVLADQELTCTEISKLIYKSIQHTSVCIRELVYQNYIFRTPQGFYKLCSKGIALVLREEEKKRLETL